jgi:eukaryotic-like serine/threonine-protein kinase
VSGWTVPGYTELKTLGAGGFGAVVLARHDATGTPVAIKYLRPGLLADPGFAELFRAEAVLLSAVDSPHVVRLYEYVESPHGAAIVMELVDGVSLHEMVARQGKTTAESALLVLYGSLLGLAAAHARGVVHRDFKPANVLVNSYGASKLTDFGISARAGSRTVPAGSLSYAPPEQFDGGPATPASDVYAATATFYECLTGHPPFRGNTEDELIAEHRTAPVPLDQVPEALRPIVAVGMAKEPAQRPADAAVLAARLRDVAAGEYGADWAERGRSHLGEAAVLLAALWPTGGAPAIHGFTAEQVQLSRGQQAAGNQHVHAQNAHGQQVTHGARHNVHQWHVLHREHLTHLRHLRWLRTATATAAACAVVAAGVTWAATGRAPGGPGTAARPAVAAYPASLASVAATVETNYEQVDGNSYAAYYTPGVLGSYPRQASFAGEVTGAAPGEVVRLYAQQFPYTSAAAPVASMSLDSVGGTARYVLSATPVLATRYQVRLLRSATATTPLATSATKTVYVIRDDQFAYASATNNCTGTVGNEVCHETISVTVYSPPSVIRTEMAKRKYLYVGFGAVSAEGGSPDSVMRLDTDGVASSPELVAANAYRMTLSYNYSVNGGAGLIGFCTQQTEAQDGIGVPGSPACGADSIPTSDYALFY